VAAGAVARRSFEYAVDMAGLATRGPVNASQCKARFKVVKVTGVVLSSQWRANEQGQKK
jgi:hypothetical protein